MHQPRIGVAVWIKSVKQARQLRKYGLVHYVSKQMKYAVIYVDQENVDTAMSQIGNLGFVERVERSEKPFNPLEYHKVENESQPQDDSIGI